MSEATYQAVHEAIAAHVADVNEGPPEYLTEWLIVASTVTGMAGRTGYYYRDSNLPYHHAIGLLHYAESVLSDYQTDDDED